MYTVKLLRKGSKKRPNREMKNIKYLVLHSTGNPKATLDDEINYLFSMQDKTPECYHAIVGSNEVIQVCSFNDRISHCGGTHNNDSIGIEICESEYLKNRIDTHINTINLFADLCKTYNIPVSNIIMHRQIYNTSCPSIFSNTDFEFFKNAVDTKLKLMYTDNKVEYIQKYFDFENQTMEYLQKYQYAENLIDKIYNKIKGV